MGGLSLTDHSSLILSLDRLIRQFVRGRDWPPNTPIDFMCDQEVGFSLLSLSVESARDLISFVWRLVRGGESSFFLFYGVARDTLLQRPSMCPSQRLGRGCPQAGRENRH